MATAAFLLRMLSLVACSTAGEAPQVVLVTGASGFLGSHVVQKLLAMGWAVRGTVRSSPESSSYDFLRSLDVVGERLELVQADLKGTSQAEWDAVARGVIHCVHVASPFPSSTPKNETEELIIPAVEGTETVIRACMRAKVSRIVLTSSVAAIEGDQSSTLPSTEESWTDIEKVDGYSRSKTLAERAAWRLTQHPETGLDPTELVVINPSFIVGPVLSSKAGSSLELIQAFFDIFRLPAIPSLLFHLVDVRDVAAAHAVALTEPEAKNQRFICSAVQKSVPFMEMAKILQAEFGPLGYWISTFAMPYFVFYALSFVDQGVAVLLPRWEQQGLLDNSKIQKTLKISFRPVNETLVQTGNSLIRNGLVPMSTHHRRLSADEL